MNMEINVNQFKEILLAENQKHNLISRRSSGEDVNMHIKDSLAILDYYSLADSRIVDIGTGAGFPGLILALACRDSAFTLIESDLKKSQFLSKLTAELQLEHVEVLRLRAEEAGRNELRGSFDYCTCRAVASMNVLLEYGLPLLHVGGKMFLWKGRNYEKEVEEAKNALEVLGGKIEAVIPY
ncbi:MAG TPA: 16S rRNA (guanine(527)-N(7))-methyltransferase RsmG, partial [Syntrophomonadaceae bacterium]|nr:16S rRNA (guanine(527)-N(7))-methyltransferase RsmG [Syntrophomonadaceae bacterium]